MEEVMQLVSGWNSVAATLRERSILDYQLFRDVFSKTYQVLKTCRGSDSISKAYMRLVISAYNFIDTPNTSADFLPRAAFMLTERMLSSCVLEQGPQSEDGTVNVYLMETYREVRLDFADVDGSIDILNKNLKKDFWDTLG